MKWSIPVSLETNEPGVYRSVGTTLDAIHVLDGWWQKVDGPAFQEAINICIDASRGEANPEDARAAFISALNEGGIVIRPVADEAQT